MVNQHQALIGQGVVYPCGRGAAREKVMNFLQSVVHITAGSGKKGRQVHSTKYKGCL
jgi:hypothetical protein